MPLGKGLGNDLGRDALADVLKEIVSGVVVVSVGKDGVSFDYANEEFFHILGYTRQEFFETVNDNILDIFDANDFAGLVDRTKNIYNSGDVIQIECSVKKKNGEKGWIIITTKMTNSGNLFDKRYVCNVVDITHMKELQSQLQEQQERYEIVQELSDDILFSYDVHEDVFEASSKMLRSLGTKTKITDAMENFTYGSIFDPRDVPTVITAYSNAISGKKVNIFDARIMNNRGDYVWYRVKFAAVYDSEGEAVKFIGTLCDIDKEKREKNRLIFQAQTDQLTGFLNKISTSLKISETIKADQEDFGALFLVDLDDFKELNDTYGHRQGDKFLKEFTNNLSHSFRSTDILGRVGGEEFVIYVSGVGETKHFIEEKASHILQICRNTRIENAPEKEFTCSVGIARFPSDAATYIELYDKADKAMYYVKKQGKNNFAFFEDIE